MATSSTPSLPIRATRAIVDLDAIKANVRALRAALPGSSRLMAVVKADGYGHGAPWVATAALEAGATLLGVATVSEGQILRDHGIEAPIVLLGSIDPDEVFAACQAKLEITVADEQLLQAIQIVARQPPQNEPTSVHLKVDTGLRRYGALPEHVTALAIQIANDPLLRLVGLSTHFASADEPSDPFTNEQWQRFEQVVRALESAGISVPSRHVANSAGVLTGQSRDCEIARPGIALYGVPPSDEVALLPGMRPALRIESRIARVIPIAPGDAVGYNRTFRADRPALGALIPLGYADGYRRALAGRSWVGISDRRAILLGRVSMDQIVVKIPNGIEAGAGDVVHVLGGEPESGAPSIAEMAEMLETNTYEVLTGIRQRIPRIFMQDGQVTAVRSQSGCLRIGNT